MFLKIFFIYFVLYLNLVNLSNSEKAIYDDDRYHPYVHVPKKQQQKDWKGMAEEELKKTLNIELNIRTAKNIIFFLGDGMGPSTVSAARVYHQQSRGDQGGGEPALSFEKFSHVGISKTYCADRQVPDSASTATAYLCGEKANMYTIGVNQNVQHEDCGAVADNKLKSIIKHAIDAGKWTGVVTTTRITHATPSATYAHTPNRVWEFDIPDREDIPNRTKCQDIAHQLIHGDYNDKIRVIFGGGRGGLIPNNETDPETTEFPKLYGKRQDGRNLIKEWEEIKISKGIPKSEYSFIKNKEEFDKIDVNSIQYVMGLLNPDHLQYEHERVSRSKPREPSLKELVEKSINILKKGAKGYVLFVEGGRIDHAHHDTMAFIALNETLAFADAVERAKEMTDERDTLIITTADHSHVFTYGNYPTTENDIFGVSEADTYALDKKPQLILSYTNGPGFLYHRTMNGSMDSEEMPRRDLTGEDTKSPTFMQDTSVPKKAESHGGEDVAIYASGPMSHLFEGVHQQHYIPYAAMYAACIGPNKDHCTKPRRDPRCPDYSSDSNQVTLNLSMASIMTLMELTWMAFMTDVE